MNYLGYMWLERGLHLDKAGDLIRQANELVPDSAAFVDSLGWFHYKKGNYRDALKELLRAESLIKEPQAEDAEIIDHIAQTYQQLGDKAKAEEYFRKALKLDPENKKTQSRLDDLQGKEKALKE
jgi:Tfp pilus assembly protein PilF